MFTDVLASSILVVKLNTLVSLGMHIFENKSSTTLQIQLHLSTLIMIG